MSNNPENMRIPRYGDAGVAFAGVELKDAVIVLVSIFLALIFGGKVGTLGYIGFPVAGYFLNRLYVDRRSSQLPGQFRAYLFAQGLLGYSKSLQSKEILFIGDADGINPGSKRVLSAINNGGRF